MRNTIAVLVAILIANLTHAGIVTFDDDVAFSPTISRAEWLKKKGGGQPKFDQIAIPPLFTQEGVVIASLCSSSSPNLTQSQRNAMAWLAGVSVPTDRIQNPSAWHAIPIDGLQWFDFVSTGFKSWRGTTIFTNTATSDERGHRIVIHAFGNYPVNAYWCKIVSTITNIGAIGFPVATNTSNGLEIPFNANFIGIETGTNNVLESFYNPSIGTFVVGGDDIVYSNGELPSQVTYDWWYRFGATVSVSVSNPSGFNPPKEQFVNKIQSLSAMLVRGGVEMGKVTVISAQPELLIRTYNPSSILVTIHGGQLWIPYELQTTVDLSGALWMPYYDQAFFSDQSVWISNLEPMRFFRLKTSMSH